MNRRRFNTLSGSAVATLIALVHGHAKALSLGDLTNAEASQGLKTALEKGALAAVSLLGKTDGFLGNDKYPYSRMAIRLLPTLPQLRSILTKLIPIDPLYRPTPNKKQLVCC